MTVGVRPQNPSWVRDLGHQWAPPQERAGRGCWIPHDAIPKSNSEFGNVDNRKQNNRFHFRCLLPLATAAVSMYYPNRLRQVVAATTLDGVERISRRSTLCSRLAPGLAFLTLVCCASPPGPVTAQAAVRDSAATPRQGTRLAELSDRNGTVVVRASTEVGGIKALYGGTMVVEAVEILVAGGASARGLVVTVREGNSIGTTGTAFVDAEEVDGLLAGIDYIDKLDNSVSKLERFQATYSTKGDLAITVFPGRDSKQMTLSVQVTGIRGVSVFMPRAALIEVRRLVESARTTLNELR